MAPLLLLDPRARTFPSLAGTGGIGAQDQIHYNH